MAASELLDSMASTGTKYRHTGRAHSKTTLQTVAGFCLLQLTSLQHLHEHPTELKLNIYLTGTASN